jgi:hypothetical protein
VLEQYGGNTQAARANNFYIRTGGYIRIPTYTVTDTKNFQVFGGDIYHVEYDMTRVEGVPDVAYANQLSARDGLIFPAITSINTYYRKGRHFVNKALADGSYPTGSEVDKKHDTFQIEEAYLKEDDFVTYIGRQVNVIIQNDFDNRVHSSNAKSNGELIDNWRQFPVLLYKDIEGAYGPINKLLQHNNTIYYFQDKACGYLLINPRASVSTTVSGGLQMGFGDVLHDFEYLSTEIGCTYQWSPISTTETVFIVDSFSKQIYGLKGKNIIPISESASMNPEVRRLLSGDISKTDNPLLQQGVHTGWHQRFNEIFFTFFNKVTIGQETTVTSNLDVIFGFNVFSGEYAQAVLVKTSLLPANPAVVGDFIQVKLTSGIHVLEILAINVNATHTYYRISRFPSPYSAYNSAVGPGNVMDIPNFLIAASGFASTIPIKEYVFYTPLIETLVYNEAYEIFTHFLDAHPKIYLNDNTNILAPNPNQGNKVYQYNKGKYGTFFDEEFPSTLDLIINSDVGATKVFENISFFSEAFTNVVDPVSVDKTTFTRVRFYTDYQNTDWLDLDITNKDSLRKVEREFQAVVPRNVVKQSLSNVDIFDSTNLDATQKFKERLRDKYMTIQLEFSNANDYRFLLHYFKTFYNVSVR